jgi:hypothetical protein
MADKRQAADHGPGPLLAVLARELRDRLAVGRHESDVEHVMLLRRWVRSRSSFRRPVAPVGDAGLRPQVGALVPGRPAVPRGGRCLQEDAVPTATTLLKPVATASRCDCRSRPMRVQQRPPEDVADALRPARRQVEPRCGSQARVLRPLRSLGRFDRSASGVGDGVRHIDPGGQAAAVVSPDPTPKCYRPWS